ncbi:phage antirepressor KilAC domain-containing protein [Xenorhabdus bovienii]|uniref:phage antirepressor KilAC domain-containing protein n=1 Tax=Xenorhabdus bovienii TaxID=40576 RepID=UPI0023B301F0|nr:phage antirepressor KilAC domain-containing protein [Xenorhabdus bovienii]MDE9539808.1 phage regulatory protein/antirepressor Ant [Xenorhabdus bovienii]MDE9552769.1 phage regulatory protein/antirepressor Ant [Xenorhabdus bovienii]
MKILAPATQAVTMSSREIAELTSKQHHHVVRDIEKMLSELGFNYPEMDDFDSKEFFVKHKNYKGRNVIDEIGLDQDLTMTLMTGYSVPLRHKVSKRWRELETGVAQPQIPQSLPEALRLAADLAEQKAELEHKVEEMKPDVAALERIAKSDGSMCVTDAAKQLQVKPKSLFDLMSHNKWIYRRMGTPWVGYQEKIQQRLIEHKVTVVIKPDGEEKTVSQVRITPKGISKLAKMLSVKEAA